MKCFKVHRGRSTPAGQLDCLTIELGIDDQSER